MALVNPQVIDHHTPSDSAEGLRVGHSLPGGSGNGVAKITFSPESKASHARPVFNKEGGIQRSGHGGHVLDIMGMNDGSVLIIVFSDQSRLNSFFDRFHSYDGCEGHHLLFFDKDMVFVRLSE